MPRRCSSAVVCGLLPVLAGTHAVPLGLQAVQRPLLALLCGGVPPLHDLLEGLDQDRAVDRRRIPVAAAVDAVYRRLAALCVVLALIGRRVPTVRLGVTLLRSPVAAVGLSVALQGLDEQGSDLETRRVAACVPRGSLRVPRIRHAVPVVRGRISNVCSGVTQIRRPTSRVHSTLQHQWDARVPGRRSTPRRPLLAER